MVGALFLTIVLLAVGGGAVAFLLRPDESQPEALPTPRPTGPTTAPAATPSAPGSEPPEDGQWPEDWPRFAPGDNTTIISDLAGVDFDFEVPEGWDCVSVTVEPDAAHYRCGPGGADQQLGGDLIVRTCPDPCDADRRVELRRAEEAWGLQWIRDGGFRAWAHSDEIDDDERYGLILVGYWRSADESRLDRQLVFRMAGPVDQAEDIQMVAASVRDQIT